MLILVLMVGIRSWAVVGGWELLMIFFLGWRGYV